MSVWVKGVGRQMFTYTLATSILQEFVVDLVEPCNFLGLHSTMIRHLGRIGRQLGGKASSRVPYTIHHSHLFVHKCLPVKLVLALILPAKALRISEFLSILRPAAWSSYIRLEMPGRHESSPC